MVPQGKFAYSSKTVNTKNRASVFENLYFAHLLPPDLLQVHICGVYNLLN